MRVLRVYDEAAVYRCLFAGELPRTPVFPMGGDTYAIGRWLLDVPPTGDVVIIAIHDDGEAHRFVGAGCTDTGLPLHHGVLSDAVRRVVAAPHLRATAAVAA